MSGQIGDKLTAADEGQFSKWKLGEILIDRKLISSSDLDAALELQQQDGGHLGEILIRNGAISPEILINTLSEQLQIPIADLRQLQPEPDALSTISELIARQSIIIPLKIEDDFLSIAMAFPDDIRAVRDISIKTGKRIKLLLASVTDINNAIDLYYRANLEADEKNTAFPSVPQEDTPADLTAQSAVAQNLDLIVNQAVKDRASDIHIDPQDKYLRIRYRIDGILHDVYSFSPSTQGPLLSRLKILAGMDIAEQRRPQDGQFTTKTGTKSVDIRVATMATAYGERATLRILDRSLSPLSLDELGFQTEQLEKFKQVLKSPFGTILVGGPTGSGKTTTLYAALNQFDKRTQNIITIEDPIEYKFSDISQTQINVRAGITFTSGLRAILRNDPDIVLIGEIRDKDTAVIATQTALTGRLVLASIHANDAVGVLFRLIDLGIEPYLISPTLIATLAQRMVRRICSYCKSPADPTPEEQIAFQRVTDEKLGGTVYVGKGCNMCANTGYRGRVALTELLTMNEDIRHLVLSGATSDVIKNAAIKHGLHTMQSDGMLKVKMGVTTIAEVIRCTF